MSLVLSPLFVVLVQQMLPKLPILPPLMSKHVELFHVLYTVVINEVYNGRQYFGPQYTNAQIEAIIKKYDNPSTNFKYDTKIKPTATEDEVLEYISEGFSTVEIAEKMRVKPRTIETHRANLIKKFDLKSGHDLLRFAVIYTLSRHNPPKS